MATTFATSFLAGLDDLSDNDAADLIDEEDSEAPNLEEAVDGDLADRDQNLINFDDLDSVSKLQKTQRYAEIMQKVEDALLKKDSEDVSNQRLVLEDDDPEYQLIVECNFLSVAIEEEIFIIHNFIRDKYRLKFPELESLVLHPINYVRVVKKIGNEMDVTLVDLKGLLSPAIIMVVSITASTTSGKPLPDEILRKTIDACDRALSLDSAKKKLLDFVGRRMGYIAPNLSAIVGSTVAAKLITAAGGLAALAKMPACDVQLLGDKKKNPAGFSTATTQSHAGYIAQTDIFQHTPTPLRKRACRPLAAKSTLAARVDSLRGDPSGDTGRALREEIQKKIHNWQEPHPAKLPKQIPVPDSQKPKKKKRGGRRLRKRKEIYAMTEVRTLANRMLFGKPEETSLGDGLGVGYGMLRQARWSSKLHVSTVLRNKLVARVNKKFKEKLYGSSDATSGLISSLAFTPVQEIELKKPQAHTLHQLDSGTQSKYFSDTATFSKIKRT